MIRFFSFLLHLRKERIEPDKITQNLYVNETCICFQISRNHVHKDYYAFLLTITRAYKTTSTSALPDGDFFVPKLLIVAGFLK